MLERYQEQLTPALRGALEEATRALVPAGFDTAVLAGAARRRFDWKAALSALIPAFACAVCFFIVGAVFLRWFTSLPSRPQAADELVARQVDSTAMMGRSRVAAHHWPLF